jgi:hypothetical protein
VQARFGTNAETEDSIIDGGAVPRGTPDMEKVLTDEEKVHRAIRTGVGEALRSYYRGLLEEPMPSRLTDLLRRLDEQLGA